VLHRKAEVLATGFRNPDGLALLAGLVAANTIRPHIAVETLWTEIGSVARRLLDRAFAGKAVLHLS